MATEADIILKAQCGERSLHGLKRIMDYIINLVMTTRDPIGAGIKEAAGLMISRYRPPPRTNISLAKASKAHALIRGRGYVTSEDVRVHWYGN
jgi:MoxR-like ATPase